jgi:hypothetical protein
MARWPTSRRLARASGARDALSRPTRLSWVFGPFWAIWPLWLAGLAGAPEARAAEPGTVTVLLPLAGLALDLPEGAWTVESRWDEAVREEWLVHGPTPQTRRYRVSLDGLTVRDCPISSARIETVGARDWIAGVDDDGAPSLCLRANGLTLRVSPIHRRDDLDQAVLGSLARAIETRSVSPLRSRVPAAGPPAAGSRGHVQPRHLPLTGLTLELPQEERWRVREPLSRDFDALIRDVPTLPELQVAVRLYPTTTGLRCRHLVAHLRQSGWSPIPADHALSRLARPLGFTPIATRTVAGFESVALCLKIGDALLDARLAANPGFDGPARRDTQDRTQSSPPAEPAGPRVDATATRWSHPDDVAAVLRTLAHARVTASARALPTSVRSDRYASHWGVALVGLHAAGSSRDPAFGGPSHPLFAGLELGALHLMANGPRLRATASLGRDGHGWSASGSAELGVSLALPQGLSLGISLGVLDRRDALMGNQALYTSFEFLSGVETFGAPAWSLRVVPLLLASRRPALSGLPLELSWQYALPNGLVLGLDLRAVSRPSTPTRDWPSDGVALGARVGFGLVSR